MAKLDAEISMAFGKNHPKPRLLTAEEEREIAEREEAEHRARRFKLSGVPDRYKDATLDDCGEGVRAYAEEIHGQKHGPWLILSGPNGTGKTHAACAVLNAENEYGVKFTTMHRILAELWDDKSSTYRYEKCRLLVIDDFGKDKPSEYNVAEFFAVLNARYDNRKPTIITTNYTSAELMDYLTVNGDSKSAKAIIDRMGEKGNHFVRLEGRSLRR